MKKFITLGMALPMLFLSGCGEGWEMKSYNNTPYGDRTAGSAVEYVRARMMPKKGTKVKVIESQIESENEKHIEMKKVSDEKDSDVSDNLLKSGEKFFREMIKK